MALFILIQSVVYGKFPESLIKENKELKARIVTLERDNKILMIGGGFCLLLLSVGIVYSIMKKRQQKKNKKRQLTQTDSPELSMKNLITSDQWLVLAASVIGKAHVKMNLPCQDSHYKLPLENNWGIAVVCDGAGSAKNSQIGSVFIAKEAAPRYFKALVEREKWIEKKILPSSDKWDELARVELINCYGALKIFAEHRELDFSSLACTIIAVVYSPLGLLVTHIGDGRAGFKDKKWFPAMIPHKGEEANQTIFLTSKGWVNNPDLKLSGVSVPESRVITKPVEAFVLMSDGCENHSFKCSDFDEVNQIWTDPNIPSDTFFNPLIEQMPDLEKEVGQKINEKWEKFLENGLESLENEPDDKTMILGLKHGNL